MSFETLSVIGLGYIGLPTAAVFASRKKKVIGVDVNKHAVETINKGKIHIVEPDLDMLVHAAVSEGYLKAVLQPEAADAFLVAVPSPFIVDEEKKNLHSRSAIHRSGQQSHCSRATERQFGGTRVHCTCRCHRKNGRLVG